MSTRRRSLAGSPTVQTLVAFLAVFLVSRLLVAVLPVLAGLFVLDQPFSQPWTLVTSVYSHANLPHLISNAVVLVLVGVPLERSTKTWAYHAYFVVTGAIAGAVQVLAPDAIEFVLGILDAITLGLLPISTEVGNVAVLGASGAVFAMLGYVLTGNRFTRGAFDRLGGEVQIGLAVLVALALTWLTAAPGVALVAHFTGLLIGLISGAAGVLPKRGGASRERNTSYNSSRR